MLDNLASQAVAAFFVISGYVITATTVAGRGWRYYAVARAARIYSVMVPALLLSLALYAGSAIYVHFGGVTVFSVPGAFSWWQLPVIVGFLGEIWTLHVGIPWDGPIWSLDYEVFYYLLFGVLIFARGHW